MQKALEAKGITILSAEQTRIPTTTTQLTEEQEKEILELVDRMEEDDDVLNVYHNMK